MADLKTNYVDDVLDATKNQLRKYQQIQNDDGTVSFVDVTEYTQVGTSFGAKDINDTNAAINDVNGKLNLSSSKLLITITSQKEQNYDIDFIPYEKILIRFTAGHIEDIIIDMSVVDVVGQVWFRRYYNNGNASNYYYAIGGYVTNNAIYIQTCGSSGWSFTDIKVYGLK